MKHINFALVALVAIGGLFAQNAAAEKYTITRSLVVKYGDLDLAQPEAASVLYQRIRNAAHRVCAMVEDAPMDLASGARRRACMKVAIHKAVASVDKPTLWAKFNTTWSPAAS
jgi:UrcA family protein